MMFKVYSVGTTEYNKQKSVEENHLCRTMNPVKTK